MSEGNPETVPQPATEQPARPKGILGEPVVLWSIVGGVVVIALAVGYVVWNHYKHGKAGNALAERSICEATLDLTRDYGVIPPLTALASPDPDKTQVDGRVTCHGKADASQYAMTVDVRCDDMGKASCLELYSVKQNDGSALFQRQH